MVGITPRRRVPASGSPSRAPAADQVVRGEEEAARPVPAAPPPAGVSSTRRRSRSKSFTPRARSAWATCALSEGWETSAGGGRPPEAAAVGHRHQVLQLAEGDRMGGKAGAGRGVDGDRQNLSHL